MCQMKKGDTTRRLGWQDLPFFADWLKGSEASLKFSRLWGRVMTGENILQPPSLPPASCFRAPSRSPNTFFRRRRKAERFP